jgi:hypothetical protein
MTFSTKRSVGMMMMMKRIGAVPCVHPRSAGVDTLQNGYTALHYAAGAGHGGVAEALLKAACNTDIQDTV